MPQNNSTEDRLFTEMALPSSFVFDQHVASVFDDMASRSIPGYHTQQTFIAEYITHTISHKNITIVDLGCSTGNTVSYITQCAQTKGIELGGSSVYAVDYSEHMIEKCKIRLAPQSHLWRCISYHVKILDNIHELFESMPSEEKNCIFACILHFVLQFIPLANRQKILQQCWDNLQPGGVLFVGEKIYSSESAIQNIWQHMQYAFKKSTGYTDTQIASKEQSLSGVLIPQEGTTLDTMLRELPRAKVELYYAHCEFRCYAVIKGSL